MSKGPAEAPEPTREMFFAAYDGQPPSDVGHPQAELVRLVDDGTIRRLQPATFQSRMHEGGAKAWLAVIERDP